MQIQGPNNFPSDSHVTPNSSSYNTTSVFRPVFRRGPPARANSYPLTPATFRDGGQSRMQPTLNMTDVSQSIFPQIDMESFVTRPFWIFF
jgi:hypothetical protein